MDRLIAPNSVPLASADTAPASGTPQYATDGNPASGVAATQWPAYQYNAIQEELIAILTAAGITPDRTQLDQLAQAVSIVGSRPYEQATAGTYSFTVPTGVYWLQDVELWGGGSGGGGAGGGAGIGTSAGTGGAPGGYARGKPIAVNPGDTVTVVVGAGGSGGGGAGSNGAAGGASSIAINGTVVLQATAGTGGIGSTSGNASWSGSVGTASGSSLLFAQSGVAPVNAYLLGASGSETVGSPGAAAPKGGGVTAISNFNGAAGNFPGGGGGGAANNGTPATGGTGASGFVRFKY